MEHLPPHSHEPRKPSEQERAEQEKASIDKKLQDLKNHIHPKPIELPKVFTLKGEKLPTEEIVKDIDAAEQFRGKIESMLRDDFPGAIGLLADSCNDPSFRISIFSEKTLRLILQVRSKELILPILEEKMKNPAASLLIAKLICSSDEKNPSKATVDFLRKKLTQEDDEGMDAGIFLAQSGPLLLQQLTQALADSSPIARRNACNAAFTVDKPSKNLITELLRCMKDLEVSVRSAAASTLAGQSEKTKDARIVPALTESLGDATISFDDRVSVALALAKQNVKEAFPILKECVLDPSYKLSKVLLLPALMVDSDRAVPVLLQVLKDNEYSSFAGEILRRNPNGSTFMKEYTDLLGDQDTHVRYWAARLIANYGQPDDRALKVLIESLTDTDCFRPPLILSPCASISQDLISKHAKIAFPKLLEIFHDERQPETLRAAIALALPIAADRERVMQELEKALLSSSLKIRVHAAGNLLGNGGDQQRLAPYFLEGLHSNDLYLQSISIMSLCAYGKGPKEALPAVEAFLQNKAKDPTIGALAQGAAEILHKRLSGEKDR